MKRWISVTSFLGFIALGTVFFQLTATSEPIKVIFETDMETDCDDAGALAMLHNYQTQGVVELLAVVTNSRSDSSVGAVDAINTYFGRPDIKLGAYKGDAVGDAETPIYHSINEDIAFPHDIMSRHDVDDAVQVYKEVLRKHDNVVIISVGHLQNIEALLKDAEGFELISKKVDRMVLAAGSVSKKKAEYNLIRLNGSDSSAYVLNHFPRPMVFSPLNVGGSINTGQMLADNAPTDPVRRAYELYPTWSNYHEDEAGNVTNMHQNTLEVGRSSWDQLAVLYAVGVEDELFEVTEEGYMFLNKDDIYNENEHYTEWRNDGGNANHANHFYIKRLASIDEIEVIISEMMDRRP